jgi:hypothetical protein
MKSTGIVRIILAVFLSIAMFSLIPLCQTPAAKPTEKPDDNPKPKMEPLPQAVVKYLNALEIINKNPKRQSLEPLLKLANEAAGALSEMDPKLESCYLDRVVDFWALKWKMYELGVVLIPGGEFTAADAYPYYEYFLQLAIKKGLEEDISFFKFMSGYTSAISWAMTNSGATKLSVLRNAYKELSDYKLSHPTSYKEALTKIMEGALGAFTNCYCVFESSSEAIAEFQAVIDMAQKDSISSSVKDSLDNEHMRIKSGRSFKQFDCRYAGSPR